MAVAIGAGQRRGLACSDATASAASWSNLRPLDHVSGHAIDQWVDLLASISHELRTPLNAVIGFSDAMQQEVFGPIGNERYQEYVRHIRTSGVELLAAAEDALAMTAVLAQPKAVRLEAVTLAPLIHGAIADLAGPARTRGLDIAVAVPTDLEVLGDHLILPRAVRQMTTVALTRASPGSGIEILARAEHGVIDLRVDVPALLPGAPPVLAGDTGDLDRGLGRRELAVWLAMALLELMDCRLTTATRGGSLSLATSLEQSSQGRFFTD